MSLVLRMKSTFRGSPGATDTEDEFRYKMKTALNLAITSYKQRVQLYIEEDPKVPVATGTLKQSGKDVVGLSEVIGLGFKAYVGFGAPYAKYVEEGRPKYHFPPLAAIKAWCILKGIPAEAAILIAWQIYHHGIEAKQFWEETKAYAKRALAEELMKAFGIMKLQVTVSF